MLFAAMNVSLHRTLEHAEEVLDVVGGEAFFVHVLAALMLDGLVIGVSLASVLVELAFVGNESGLSVDVLTQNVTNGF